MSDLISRSQLLKEIETWGGCVDALHDYIQNMPTAYDVDTVVNQLELHSFSLGITELPAFYVRLNDAIKIVKGGGVDG